MVTIEAGPGDTVLDRARLWELRQGRNWSQAELAERAGLSQSAISALESGRRDAPEVATVRALASALGVPVGELLADGAERAQRRAIDELLRELGERVETLPVEVPVLRTLANAGNTNPPPSEIADWVYLPPRYRKRPLRAVRVTGTCLSPEVNPGDTVVFDLEAPYEVGRLVVAQHDGDVVVKRLEADPHTGGWLLTSNTEPPLRVNGDTRIYGRVIVRLELLG